MDFTYIKFFLVIFLGIISFVPTESLSDIGQEADDTQENKVIELRAETLEDYSGRIKGVELTFPKEIRLKGNEPDLSSVIQQLKRVEESHHDNTWSLGDISDYFLYVPVKELCDETTDPKKCFSKASKDLETAIEEINQKMAGRILYPDNYSPVSEGVYEADFQSASQVLDSKCAGTCNSSELSRAFSQSSQEQYQQLYDKLKGKSSQCQRDLLSAMAFHLETEYFPKPCLKKENKSHPVCKDMIENMDIIRERVSKIMNLVYGSEGGMEAKTICVDCLLNTEEIHPLEGFFKSLEEKSQCFELNSGEEKEVFSNSGLRESYNLKRDLDGSYSIIFPVKFYVDEDYDGPVSKERVPDHYRDQVQQCLAEASQKLLGPNGEELKIQIKDPSKGKNNSKKKSQCWKSPGVTTYIYIGSKDHRSTPRKYEWDIDCPTITHEFLHLTGLCDEYKEQTKGFYTDPETGKTAAANFGKYKNEEINPSSYDFTPAFDCRVTAQNSIMADHWDRWDNVENGKNESLLTPAQFQSILYGGCPGKNKRFNECSQLAYQSSQTAEKDCREAKLQCEKENGMKHDKQDQIEALQEEIEELRGLRKFVLDMQKHLRDQGEWNKTKRDWYNKELKDVEEQIRSERNFLALAQSEGEKSMREEIIQNNISLREWFLMDRKIDEEKGNFDQTLGQINERRLSSAEEALQAAREKLEIVQSWPTRTKR